MQSSSHPESSGQNAAAATTQDATPLLAQGKAYRSRRVRLGSPNNGSRIPMCPPSNECGTSSGRSEATPNKQTLPRKRITTEKQSYRSKRVACESFIAQDQEPPHSSETQGASIPRRRLNKRQKIMDQRTHNAATADEVAVIWLDSSSALENNTPHIVVSGKSDKSHRILHYYGCYDPLQYPILFLHGECGWHRGMEKEGGDDQSDDTNPIFPLSTTTSQTAADLLLKEARVIGRKKNKEKKSISCRQCYAYRLQIRYQSFILRSGRLFQQYIVDIYVKIENIRLDYFRDHQRTIRANLYQGLVDSLAMGEKDAGNIGNRVILPPSFIGGPRDMRRRYLNAMALVQRLGKPDLFITMTCNPKWPEITQELRHGEKVQNRPDFGCTCLPCEVA